MLRRHSTDVNNNRCKNLNSIVPLTLHFKVTPKFKLEVLLIITTRRKVHDNKYTYRRNLFTDKYGKRVKNKPNKQENGNSVVLRNI